MRDIQRIISFADRLKENPNSYIAALASALAEVARHAVEMEDELTALKDRLSDKDQGEVRIRL